MATIDKSLAILGLPDEGTSIGEAVKAYRLVSRQYLVDSRWYMVYSVLKIIDSRVSVKTH